MRGKENHKAFYWNAQPKLCIMNYELCILLVPPRGIPPAGSWEPTGFHMDAPGEAFASRDQNQQQGP